MRPFTILTAFAATACGSSTSPAHVNLNAARAALRTADSALSQANFSGLATGFADSAIYEQTGLPIIIGRAHIQSTLTTLYSAPGYSLTWTSFFVDVSSAGDVGYTYGQAAQVDPAGDTILGPGQQ